MNSRILLWCAWSGPVFLILYGIAFWGIAGYMPPHSPMTSPDALVAFYEENRTGIRVGQILGLVFSMLLFPWFALISVQIAQAEKRFPVLALMQFGAGTLLIVFFVVCSMLWIAATYRPELDPETLRTMHETSWLMFVMVFPEFTLQVLCIALAGFMDRRPQPLFPRWLCYFNLWVGISAFGGSVAVFFKSGPFAWSGLFGFWLPVFFFSIWLFVMAPVLARNVRRLELEAG
jgi:hypothetical protein